MEFSDHGELENVTCELEQELGDCILSMGGGSDGENGEFDDFLNKMNEFDALDLQHEEDQNPQNKSMESEASLHPPVEVKVRKRLSNQKRKSLFGMSDTKSKKWAGKFEWEEDINQINQCVFGNQSFRENQREIINALLSKQDAVALIPTGGGKSLTFQVSAARGGVTFVIMPLISLIEDNLNFVLDLGIPACSLSDVSGMKEDNSVRALYAAISKA